MVSSFLEGFGRPVRGGKKLRAVLIISTLLICLWSGAVFAHGKIAQKDKLLAQARDRGLARVIVRLSFPEIKAMTEASVAHKVRLPGRMRTSGAKAADARLEREITSVASDVLSRIAARGGRVKRIHKTIPFLSIDVSEEVLLFLESRPEVLSIAENRAIPLREPVEMQAASETGEFLTPLVNENVNLIGADIAWSRGYTGEGWYVAVLDTGILWNHEFFSGKDILEACFTSGVSGATSLCPNGLETQIGGDHAAEHHDASYGFAYDHGTHVAGIAVGRREDGTLTGVAKDANIIAINVFTGITDSGRCGSSSPCLLAYEDDLVEALLYVYSLRDTHSIASVNMSLGGNLYSDQALCDAHAENVGMKAAIDNLRDVGIATVIASGNNGQCGWISSPACISSAIAVGATDDLDEEAGFSNWHPILLELFAPGVSILSSTADGDSSYASWSGTSMATPHVAGAWAILKQQRPNASVNELWEALESISALVSGACIAPNDGAKPRIQVDAALLPQQQPVVTITAIDPTASETASNRGKFQVLRTGDVSSPLVVSIGMGGGTALNGQDYVWIPSTVTIPVGKSAIKIKVNPIDDSIKEYPETVRVKIKLSPDYMVGLPRKAYVTITDND